MNYLLDKKAKRKKLLYVVSLILLFIIVFYFRSGIWKGFAGASEKIFHPVFVLGNNIGVKFGNLKSYFLSKNSLDKENQDLKSKMAENEARMSNYRSLVADNASLEEMLGRKNEKTPMTLAAILGKPNQSPYDTLIIDAGAEQNVQKGDLVFSIAHDSTGVILESAPIGRIADTYQDSSKVVLFSNSGEKTQVVISGKNIFMELVGRGGGNFEMVIPRELTLAKGDQVVLPGMFPYVAGIVETIVSDPRDPFVKALLVSPVNVQEIKFVQVEKQK